MPDALLSGHCPNCLITTALDGAFLLTEEFDPKNVFGDFGDYELIEEIARGGMGVVYRARQKSLNRLVAVKMLLAGEFASPEFVRRFQKEAEAAARLQHPNIVRIHEVGQERGQHFFSMELIEGSDLAGLVRERPLSPRRAAAYVKSIAEAVEFAHARGTLHRDLKPSNILIDPFDQPRITDFGLARHFRDADLTQTTQAFGSPAYISPEQARGSDVGPASDIYSLGALLYHLVTGRPPFQSETIHEILRQVQEREPLPPRSLNPSVPADLQTICLKCLEKEPVRRFSSAADLAAELNRFLNDEPIQSRPVSIIEKSWRWSRRRPVTAGLAAALVLATLGGVAGIFSQWQRATKSEHEMALNLYAADVRAAANALDEGDLGLARRLLALHQPRREGAADLRGFEWRYLWSRCQGEQKAVLKGHESIVTSTALSSNGNVAASGGMDGRLCVWDTKHSRLLTNFVSPGQAIWDVQFSGNGESLLAAGFGGIVQIWNTSDWSPITNFPGRLASQAGDLLLAMDSSPFPWPEEPAGPARAWNLKTGKLVWQSPGKARRGVLSPNGKLAALQTTGDVPKIEVWEIETGQIKHTFEREKPSWSLAFSPSNDRLLACGWNRNFTIFDLSNGGHQTVTNAHDLTIWNARFSPDGERIITASSDRTVALWDAHNLKPIRRMRGHENEVWSATFAPDGRSMVSGGKDHRVLLWDMPADRAMPQKMSAATSPPLFSADGKRLLTRALIENEWHTFVYILSSGLLEAEHTGYALGFSEDSGELVWFDDARAALNFTALTNVSVRRSIRLDLSETEFPVKQISANGRWFYWVDRNGMAGIWNLRGDHVASFTTLEPPIRAARISPDGKWLAVAVEREYDVHLYRIPDGELTRLKGHRDHVTGIDFSADSKLIATGSVDAEIRIFNAATGQLVSQFSGHLEEASDVAFSTDGRTLASVGTQSALKLWHLPTGREVLSIPMSMAGFHLAFSPDGQRLAVSRHDQVLEVLNAP